jgi:hypothetical protein
MNARRLMYHPQSRLLLSKAETSFFSEKKGCSLEGHPLGLLAVLDFEALSFLPYLTFLILNGNLSLKK